MSNTVIIEVRLHHNNQKSKAVDALLSLIEDAIDGPQEENGIAFVVTEVIFKEVI